MDGLAAGFRRELPGAILSRPSASIYTVIDVRGVARAGFSAQEFVLYCAREGSVQVDGQPWTLLVSPIGGFYDRASGLGTTQMRIACVEPEAAMDRVPRLFAELLRQYEAKRA
jgi:aspartate aminotransferase